MKLWGIILLAVVLLLPGVAWASERGPAKVSWSLGANFGLHTPRGDDFDGARDGKGVEARAGMGLGRDLGVDLSLVFGYSRHGTRGDVFHVNAYTLLFESRLVRGRWVQGISYFAGGRIGWVWGEAVKEWGDFSISSDGYAVGVLAGISVPLAGQLRGEFSTNVMHLSFDPVAYSGIGSLEDRFTGQTIGVEVGVSLPLTGGER